MIYKNTNMENIEKILTSSIHPVLITALRDYVKSVDPSADVSKLDPGKDRGCYSIMMDKERNMEEGTKLRVKFIQIANPDYELPDLLVPSEKSQKMLLSTINNFVHSAVFYWNMYSEQNEPLIKHIYTKCGNKVPGPLRQLPEKEHVLKMGDLPLYFSIDIFYEDKNGNTYVLNSKDE